MKYTGSLIPLIAFLLFWEPVTAQAYVDPSVMTYTVQAIAGVVVGLGAIAGIVWTRVKKKTKKALKMNENSGKEVEEDLIVKD